MGVLSKEIVGEVFKITIDDGSVNTVTFDAIKELSALLDEAEKSPCNAVVIAGNQRVLSAGFDLNTMMTEKAPLLVADGFQILERLFVFPKPIVVACTGHAMALGAVLLCVSDYAVGPRLTKDGKPVKIGLNETFLNMTMPWPGIEFARWRLNTTHFGPCMAIGMIQNAEKALAAGYLNEVVDYADVVPAAMKIAASFCELCKQPAFEQNKLRTRRQVIEYLKGEGWQQELAAMRGSQRSNL